MEKVDWELFVDGSSFVKNGIRKAGYAVVTQHEVIEDKALTPHTESRTDCTDESVRAHTG